MHAIERLRSIARAGEIESTELACEAAYALAGLSDDRRALVASCRRLLEFHPHVGALWWTCAQLIDSNDLRHCAVTLVDQLEQDASIDELFSLPSAQDRVVAESSRQIVRALHDRVDLPVRLVGDGRSLRLGMRFFTDSVAPVEAYQVTESELAFRDATLVVIEALAASRDGLLVSKAASRLVVQAREQELPVVVLAGVGRVLPDALFGAMQDLGRLLKAKDQDREWERGQSVAGELLDRYVDEKPSMDVHEHSMEQIFHDRYVIGPDLADRYVTARGVQMPAVVFHSSPSVSHLRCPVPEELLSGFGVTR